MDLIKQKSSIYYKIPAWDQGAVGRLHLYWPIDIDYWGQEGKFASDEKSSLKRLCNGSPKFQYKVYVFGGNLQKFMWDNFVQNYFHLITVSKTFRWSQGLIFHQALVDCARAGILLPLGNKYKNILLPKCNWNCLDKDNSPRKGRHAHAQSPTQCVTSSVNKNHVSTFQSFNEFSPHLKGWDFFFLNSQHFYWSPHLSVPLGITWLGGFISEKIPLVNLFSRSISLDGAAPPGKKTQNWS